MDKPNYAKWDLTSDIDWASFSHGQHLTFFRAVDEDPNDRHGFKIAIYGFFDNQGRIHVVGNEISPIYKGDEK